MGRLHNKQVETRAAMGQAVLLAWLAALLIAGCGAPREPAAGVTARPTPSLLPATSTARPMPVPLTATPAAVAGLSTAEVATLSSLVRLDDYPLYRMEYFGSYQGTGSYQGPGTETRSPRTAPAWACSLFAALGDPERMLYGRNFDWEFSPALLLFTDPPDGYASVSMVDIAYLGFPGEEAMEIDRLPPAERLGLLDAPLLPFDGMNEHGLVVGMAAVPPGNAQPDPQKQTIGSLGIIREMLDHARTVEEALALVERYNVDMAGGPPLHYLVADGTGKALLLEFYAGALRVLPNEAAWHQATNFLRASVPGDAQGRCRRHDLLSLRLIEAGGRLAAAEALDLLSAVSQESTQWSVVYGLQTGQVQVVMGRAYSRPHTQTLKMAPKPLTVAPAHDS